MRICLVTTLFLCLIFTISCGKSRTTSPRQIAAVRDAYLQNEGHDARAQRFEELVMEMTWDDVGRKGRAFTREEIFDTLGPPTYQHVKNGDVYVYLYDRFGEDDWYVRVEANRAQKNSQFGFNAASELDASEWKKYEPPTESTE